MNKELRYAFDRAIRDVFCQHCGNRFDSSKCHEYDCYQNVVLPIREALEVASGEREKYRWHDLRKDPNDLPTTDDEVLVYAKAVYDTYTCITPVTGYFTDGAWCLRDDRDGDEVIKWCYIEPLKARFEK